MSATCRAPSRSCRAAPRSAERSRPLTSLDQARQGKSAARQIRIAAQAGVLTGPELFRLLDKVDAGFAQMLPEAAPPPIATSAARGFAPIVHDGGRS